MKRKEDPHEHGAKKHLKEAIYKVLHKHPNRTFNHKQLAKQIKQNYMTYVREFINPDAETNGVSGELKKELMFILAQLMDKGEILEADRGSFKLKPKHAYMEGIIDISAGGAAYLLS